MSAGVPGVVPPSEPPAQSPPVGAAYPPAGTAYPPVGTAYPPAGTAYPPAVAPPAWRQTPAPTTHSVAGRRLLTGVILAGFLLASAALLWVFNVDLGWRTAAFTAAVSALPLLVVVPLYRWVDQLEPEPARYLWFAFLWGALCAPLGALLLNTAFHTLLMMSGVSNADSAAAVLSAPPVEEGLKGLGVLLILLVRRREFDGVIDGIVYAGMAGAGFAFSENILYLGHAYAQYGNEGLGATFILRCLMAPFAHPLFTACVGIGLGLAASVARTLGAKIGYGLLGYGCAMLLHGVWNLSAILDSYFQVYLMVQVPLFVGFLALLLVLRRREGETIRRQLTAYADHGWFTYPEVAMLASVRNRRQARQWAHAWIGARGDTAMAAFQAEASDLALLRQRMTTQAADQDAVARERELLTSIAGHRAELFAAAHAPRLGR